MSAGIFSRRTNWIIRLLKLGGLWLNYSDHKYGNLITALQIMRFAYLTFGWYLNVHALFVQGVGYLLTSSAAFIPIDGTLLVCAGLVLSTNRGIEYVLRLSDRIASDHRESWEKEIFEKDTELICKLGNLLLYVFAGFSILYVLGPFAVDLIRAALGSGPPYLLPMPLDGYLEEGVKERNLKLYAIMLFQILWFACAIPSTIAFESLTFFAVSYVASEIKIIRTYVRNLYDENDTGVEPLPDWKMGLIIKKHQQVIRLNAAQRKYTTIAFTAQYVTSTFSFCFLMFLINQVIGEDFVITVMAVVFTVLLAGIIAVCYYSGEYLEHLSLELFREICDLPWYRESPKSRRNILMMLTQSNRTMVLDFKAHFSINLRAFMQIINTAYSYYMLMKSIT